MNATADATGSTKRPARRNLKKTATEVRSLLSKVHLTPLTFGIAIVTLVILLVVILLVDQIPQYLSSHPVEWLAILGAYLVAIGLFVGDAISLSGAVEKHLRAVDTFELEVAESLTAMATPESVGSLALTMRYLMGQGLSSAEAGAATGLSSFVSTVVAAIALPIAAILAASSVNTAQLKQDVPSSTWEVILAVLGVGAIVTVAIKVPRLRQQISKWLKSAGEQVAVVLRKPSRSLVIAGGEVLSVASQVACLDLLVHAIAGRWVTISALVVIVLLSSTASSVVPIPGGLGAPEMIIAAGLTSVGVDHTYVFVIAVMYRFAVYWLPPLPGTVYLFALVRRRVL
jgi:glycosyltransferase 2 family protein